jgi:hypothetical protein
MYPYDGDGGDGEEYDGQTARIAMRAYDGE